MPLRRGVVGKACRSRCRLHSRHHVAASAGGTGCLRTIRSSPARPQHRRSSLPPPRPLAPPPLLGPRQTVALPGTRSIGIHPRHRSSHPLSAQRNDSQPGSATSHSAQTPQSASPTPTLCVSPCRSSSRKSSPRSNTCSSCPFPPPQTRPP